MDSRSHSRRDDRHSRWRARPAGHLCTRFSRWELPGRTHGLTPSPFPFGLRTSIYVARTLRARCPDKRVSFAATPLARWAPRKPSASGPTSVRAHSGHVR